MDFDDRAIITDDEELEEWEHERRRWLPNVMLWLLLGLAVLGVVLLPRILSLPAVRERVVSHINEKIAPATLAVDEWSLCWRRGQRASGVSFSDPERGVDIAIGDIEVSARLLSLLPYRSVNTGTITLSNPTVKLTPQETVIEEDYNGFVAECTPTLVDDDEESDVEAVAGITDVVESQPAVVSKKKKTVATSEPLARLRRLPVKGRIVVNGGRVVLGDATFGAVTLLDQLSGALAMSGWREPLVAEAEATAPLGENSGTLAVKGELPAPELLMRREFSDPACLGSVHMAIDSLDLRTLAPLLAFFSGKKWVDSGMLDLKADISFKGREQVAAKAELGVVGLVMAVSGTAPPAPGDVHLNFAARRDNRGVVVDSCKLVSPWGEIRADGRLETSATEATPVGVVTARGRGDLATLVRDFRPLLRINEALGVNRGEVSFDAKLSGSAHERGFVGEVAAHDLALVYDNKPVRISRTPRLVLEMRLPYTESPIVDKFELTLPFAAARGAGRFDKGALSGEIDLTAMSRDYRNIIAGCPLMVGNIMFRIGSTRVGSHAQLDTTASIENLAVQLRPSKRVVVEQADIRLLCRVPLEEGLPRPVIEDISWTYAFDAGVVNGGIARVLLAAGGKPSTAEGITVAVDLELAKAIAALGTVVPLAAGTTFEGRALFNTTAEFTAGTLAARYAAAIHNFRFKSAKWGHEEREARANGSVEWRLGMDELKINETVVSGEWLEVVSSGMIRDLAGSMAAKLDGTLKVDYDVLGQRIAATGLNMAGAAGKPAARNFTFQGNLANGVSALRSYGAANGSLGVGSLYFLGLDITPADTSFKLKDGLLSLAYRTQAGAGKITLLPQIQVAIHPPVMEIDGTSLILERVPLTQPMTDMLLAMANPLLRGCLAGEGGVSLEVSEMSVPLAAGMADQIEATCRIKLHDAPFVMAGVLGEILAISGVEAKEVRFRETEITAVCRDGKVTTSPFEVSINGHIVRFHGVVGFDHSVAYIVEVPLSRKLVGKRVWPYVEGIVLRFPVGGTLTNLQFDKEGARREAQRILREAAGRVVDGGTVLEVLETLFK